MKLLPILISFAFATSILQNLRTQFEQLRHTVDYLSSNARNFIASRMPNNFPTRVSNSLKSLKWKKEEKDSKKEEEVKKDESNDQDENLDFSPDVLRSILEHLTKEFERQQQNKGEHDDEHEHSENIEKDEHDDEDDEKSKSSESKEKTKEEVL